MSDLIEGMAKAAYGVADNRHAGMLPMEKMLKAALSHLANNPTPEMVEAAWDGLVSSMLADTTEKGHAHVKAALTAALKAAGKGE